MKNPFKSQSQDHCHVAEEDNCHALTVVEPVDIPTPQEEPQVDDMELEDPDCEVDECCSWPLRMAVAIVITLSAVWLFSCLYPFVKLILETKEWDRIIALCMFAVPAILILICFVYVVWGYFHLPKIIKYSRKAYQGKESKLALLLLRRYISRIRYSKNAYAELVGDHAADVFDKLRGLGVDKYSEWLKLFETYQCALDEQAKHEISKFSMRIGATTVISQTRATDMIAVVVLSAMMLLKLARIYNQRMSTMSALRLAVRWSANVYVAGETQTVSRKVAKVIGKAAGVAATAIGAFVGQPVIGAGTAKACDMASGAIGIGAEFAVNKILAKKLGAFAHKQLHVLDD